MFEVGDKVLFDGSDMAVYGVPPLTEGVILEDSSAFYGKYDGLAYYEVEFPHESMGTVVQSVAASALSLSQDA